MAETVTIPRELFEANLAVVKECLEVLRETKGFMLDMQAELRFFNRNAQKAWQDQLLTCKAAAEYLGVDPSTVSRMLRDQRISKVTRGGCTGILKSELDRVKHS